MIQYKNSHAKQETHTHEVWSVEAAYITPSIPPTPNFATQLYYLYYQIIVSNNFLGYLGLNSGRGLDQGHLNA